MINELIRVVGDKRLDRLIDFTFMVGLEIMVGLSTKSAAEYPILIFNLSFINQFRRCFRQKYDRLRNH